MTNKTKNEQSDTNSNEMRFGFGANWADYVEKNFSDERVEISQRHLLGFLKLPDLSGKSFLDIGCGSGLHSLAAFRAGAKQIISFDYDVNSVATTTKLRKWAGSPDNWQVMQGSVLDDALMASLPKADVVYSWGVLHHTGSMWNAIRNASRPLSSDGVFYIALYSKDAYVSPPYDYWLDVKRAYNRAGSLKKKAMEWQYAWRDCIRGCLIRGKNPIAYMTSYKRSRGMSYWHDVKDWLGGYPMEFAGNKETEIFAHENLFLDLIHQKAGEGNTEFLFRHHGAKNYWDDVAVTSASRKIEGEFSREDGHAWRVALRGADVGDPLRLMLYEDGSPIGWPNAPLSSIRAWGSGRYRVDGGDLILSSTDNTDPNSTKKQYTFRADFL
jgi:SAM-dependent methyltransferase